MAAAFPSPGDSLGRFLLLEEIGVGGMGVVFRAHDERLNRDVALKVLPPHALANDAERNRFRTEALAISRLSHPNVATIHEFDADRGIDFLVMEFVPGKDLAQYAADRSLPESEIIAIGEQIASALQDAHSSGIVHRDLKPANVMRTPRGQVKLLDFGLAKLIPRSSDPTLLVSAPHEVKGTLVYMSPEQLRADPTDARTDLYALGAILFELATGRCPFQNSISTTLIGEILHTPAPPASQFTPAISPALDAVISRCLQKNPALRFQSAAELLSELQSIARASTFASAPSRENVPVSKRPVYVVSSIVLVIGISVALYFVKRFSSPPRQLRSIAVLPLLNLSNDSEQEFFADGITDELITDLSRIPDLRVISRTSAMQYKRASKPLPLIAHELGVDAVIEGSVTRAGERVRISAKLISAAETAIWAETYERDLRDILALQSEVAQAIARQVQIKLSPDVQKQLAATRSVDPTAHLLYLKGRFVLKQRTRESVQTAIQDFNQALQADPSYAPAYAGLADAYRGLGTFWVAPNDTMPQARAAALKALELDPSLAEAHTALGAIYAGYDWDWKRAEDQFQLALADGPGSADVHATYGWFLTNIGRNTEAIASLEHAQQLDPLSPAIATLLCRALTATHDYNRALQQCRKAVDISPTYWSARMWLAYNYEQKGDFGSAEEEFNNSIKLDDTPVPRAWLGHLYGIRHDRAGAQRMLRELERISTHRYVCPTLPATVYITLGDTDRALSLFEKAVSERSECLLILGFDARLDPIRSNPRFQGVLARMNFPDNSRR